MREGRGGEEYSCCSMLPFRRQRSSVKHGPPVPLLRGYFHVIGMYLAVLMLPLVVILVPGRLAKGGVALATGIKAFLFFVSAIAHTTEFQTMKINNKVFAVDHANIFISLATNITALHCCRCGSHLSPWPIISIWICTYMVILKIICFGRTMNKGVQVALVITVLALTINATVSLNLNSKQIYLYGLLVAMGISGTFVWAFEAPNPIKGVLEFHEVFHILSLIYQGVETVLLVDAAMNK